MRRVLRIKIFSNEIFEKLVSETDTWLKGKQIDVNSFEDAELMKIEGVFYFKLIYAAHPDDED